jgi:hypothetical protein
MMGKIPKPGKSFGGCVAYNVLKKDAVILDAIGVRIDQVAHITYDFNLGRKMNPALGQAVGHIALNWSPNDIPRLSDELMLAVAHEYLVKMKIQDTQLLIVRHHDKAHPHLHIVYNRVDNRGKTISDKYQHVKNAKVCKELTLKHGFFMATGKEQVNRQQLKGADKVRYELFDAIRSEFRWVNSMDELKAHLSAKGIEMLYKFKSGTTEVQGISFAKDGYKFKGSEIDRSMSYGNLVKAIEQQVQQRQEEAVQHKTMISELRQALQEFESNQPTIPVSKQELNQFVPAADYDPSYEGYGTDINIADDVDDEAIHGRNRRRSKQARTNTR